jgi:hypothetical protein
MTPRQFAKFLDRDQQCWHCGLSDETLIPHHRQNRGMGGSKIRDNAANIIVMCAEINTAMESDSRIAEAAQKYGWKIESWAESTDRAVYDRPKGLWFYLDNDYNRVQTRKEK